MEKRDEELVNRLLAEPGNEELRRLITEHRDFENQLEEFNRRVYLTEQEQLARKNLQKKKLAGRDRIEKILAAHREKGTDL